MSLLQSPILLLQKNQILFLLSSFTLQLQVSHPDLEQTIQTTATSQSTHNTRANPRATRPASSIILVLPLRRIPLLRVHGLLLVLHGRLVVALLLAAVVILLAGWRAVGTGPAHGRRRTAVAAGLLIGTGVVGLGWVGGRRAVGTFVGHFWGCGLFVWWEVVRCGLSSDAATAAVGPRRFWLVGWLVVVVVVWGSGSGIGRVARDEFAPGSWGCFDVLAIGGVIDCEDGLNTDEERSSREMCRSTGDGRRQYKSNGGPRASRAWKALGSPSAAMGSWERAQQEREGGGVRVASTQCTLCEGGRSYQFFLVIGLCTNIACTSRASNWNRCCGESLVHLVKPNYSSRRIATAIADSSSLAPHAVSYVHYALCARERL